MSGNFKFFDLLEDLIGSQTNDTVEKTKDELKEYDVTTDEGYGNFMKFLGDLKIKAGKHSEFFKVILGEDVGDLIDRIAQEATDQHEAAKQKKEAETATKPQKSNTDSNKKTIDIAESHKCDCKTEQCPSDKVSDEKHQSICNIVDRYINENFDDDIDTSWLESELVEFACWLNK